MSGKKIMLFVGGAFVVAIIIFFLIQKWDYLGNLVLCWGQSIMGIEQDEHFHFPLSERNGGGDFTCTFGA